jgi:hypothetical protein
VDAYHSLEHDGGRDDLVRLQRRMLERFLTQPQRLSQDDVDYLLDKIDQLSLAAAHATASAAAA